ncbi:peptidase A24A, prepilin type IV [Mycolicibacterium canariasense]|uniref:Peptidase A24A, prepilin type IV n=1 Tax=Mycolicibacterium canariasense TaxID=228230 RepID=A0A100WHL0_MYCCR|nr:A24 family peptidase [Mycolicibacterium canariasense]MCV7213597.1 prepilin peptidase [Mycolicibacterium canariasense]ORV09112.1 peptidase A24 [Mycolicibacterium canariasense]GAS98436.1 peptidase A24A, prepilin type IV [Mycolicibacterium canariasense]
MALLFAGYLVVGWLITLSAFDVRHRRLPNVLTLPGAALVLGVAVLAGRGWPALAGAAALTAVYLLVHLVAPAGLGAGDVKLAIGLGALAGAFGADVWTLAAIGAPLLTGVWAVTALAMGRRSPVPHGPSMCAATAAAVILVLA